MKKRRKEIDLVKETTRITKRKLALSFETKSDEDREKIPLVQIFSSKKKAADMKHDGKEIKR